MSESLLQTAQSVSVNSGAPGGDMASMWREFFADWPAGVSHQGILVTLQDEQVPFSGFMTSDKLLLLDRRNPDNTGARKLLIPYSQIAIVKLVDVLGGDVFTAAGFSGKLAH